ncbi:hypothetical protein PFAS1_16025 [Pseudomonas frederiksbergensis]|nr:hypothetical protein PFAS1_16025 [Pseudomonas frederiksbergensis]
MPSTVAQAIAVSDQTQRADGHDEQQIDDGCRDMIVLLGATLFIGVVDVGHRLDHQVHGGCRFALGLGGGGQIP